MDGSGTSVKDTGPEEPLDSGKGLVVFQCASCNVIIGDSTSWICANSVLRTVTLSDVSEYVVKGDALLTSQTGPDLGSTYHMLNCTACQQPIGRCYKTTSRNLDEIRDRHTLDFDKLNMYQLGQRKSGTSNVKELISSPTITSLVAELKKVKRLMVVLNNRMVTVEQALEIENQNGHISGSSLMEQQETSDQDKGDRHCNGQQSFLPTKQFFDAMMPSHSRGATDSQLEAGHMKRKSTDVDMLHHRAKKRR